MNKLFKVDGCIEIETGEQMTEGEFLDTFIEFIEKNKWSFGGGICDVTNTKYKKEP